MIWGWGPMVMRYHVTCKNHQEPVGIDPWYRHTLPSHLDFYEWVNDYLQRYLM